jgi:hypothetical protein
MDIRGRNTTSEFLGMDAQSSLRVLNAGCASEFFEFAR